MMYIIKLVSIAMGLFWIAFQGVAKAMEPISIDDIVNIEKVGSVSVSPDGAMVAYDIIRPASAFKKSINSPIIDGLHLRESFVYDVKSKKTKKLFNEINNTDWIGPWSPDGSKLIVYRLNVSRSEFAVGIYDLNKNKYIPLPGVPVWPIFGKLGSLDTMLWLSDSQVIYAAAPPGDIFASRAGGSTKDRWQTIDQIYRGEALEKASVTAYDSGPSGVVTENTNQRLIYVDVKTGKSKEIISGAIIGFNLAPNKRYLAVVSRSNKFVLPGKGVEIGGGRANGMFINEIRIVDLENTKHNMLVTSSQDVNLKFPIHWSSDGSLMSYYAFRQGESWERSEPYLYDVTIRKAALLQDGELETVLPKDGTLGGESAAPVFFIGNEPYVLAPEAPKREDLRGTFAYSGHWRQRAKMLWRLSRSQLPAAVQISGFQNLKSACPGWGRLLLQNENGLFAASPSDLLTREALKPLVVGNVVISSCSGEDGLGGGKAGVIAVAAETPSPTSDTKTAYIIKADGSGLPGIIHLSKDESIVSASNDGRAIATVEARRAWETLNIRIEGQRSPTRVVSVNDWILHRQFPLVERISYQIPGEPAEKKYTAWYMLPLNYKKGKRYPVIVTLYPGRVQRDGYDPSDAEIIGSPYNPHVAASKGYATMWISAPVNPNVKELDIPKQLAAAVTGATDEAVRQGWADPARLVVYGHSSGGYAVASVLTETSRFAAGIAVAGIYNLTSFYGAFSPLLRHQADAHLDLFYATYLEGSTGWIRAAPWENPERYIRNSPLFKAEAIETPLLLIHGNEDYVPVAQAEEMFTALVRQGKKARFVRYWGEQHIPAHPANKIDSWKQIEKWLYTHLKGAEKSTVVDRQVPVSHCCTHASTSTK